MKPREFWIEFGGDPSDDKEVYKRYCAAVPFKGVDFSDEVVHCVEYSAYEKLESEFEEFFMDFMGQGCGKFNREKEIMEYDHMCLSTYEHGVQYALEKGWIDKDQVTR